MKHFRLVIVTISILCIISGCSYIDIGESKETSDNNTYDLSVETSLGSLDFLLAEDSIDYTIYYNDTGYIYVENKANQQLVLKVKDKKTLVETSYILDNYECSIINVYNPGEYVIIAGTLDQNNNMDSNKSIPLNFESSEEIQSLGVSFYTNTAGCIEVVNAEIEYIESIEGSTFTDKLYRYLMEYSYNYDLADMIKSNSEYQYRTNFENCINSRSGICLDTASLGVAILRNYGIPSRLVFGYYNNAYHAWIEYKKNNEWFIMDSVNQIHTNVEYMNNYKSEKYF